MTRRSLFAMIAAAFFPKPTTTLSTASLDDWRKCGTIKVTGYFPSWQVVYVDSEPWVSKTEHQRALLWELQQEYKRLSGEIAPRDLVGDSNLPRISDASGNIPTPRLRGKHD